MSNPIASLGNKTPEQLKVAELREELRKRGANSKGLKKELVERLEEILQIESEEGGPKHKTAENDLSTERSDEPPPSLDEHDTVSPESDHPAPRALEFDEADSEPKTGISFDTDEPMEHDNTDLEAVTERSNSDPVNENASKGVSVLPLDSIADSMPFMESSLDSQSQLHDGSEVPSSFEVNPPEESLELKSDGTELSSEPLVTEVVGPTDAQEAQDDVVGEIDSTELAEVRSKPEADSKAWVESTSERYDVKSDDIPPVVVEKGDKEHAGDSARESPSLTRDSSQYGKLVEPVEAELIRAETTAASRSLDEAAEQTHEEQNESADQEAVGQVTETTTTTTTTEVVTEIVTEVTVTTEVTETTSVMNTEAMDVSEGNRTAVLRSTEIVTLKEDGNVIETKQEVENGSKREEAEEGMLIQTGMLEVYSGREHKRDKSDDSMEVEEDGKEKDSKAMDIDIDIQTGSKRKDEDEGRQQEPAKRQRRWNSAKSTTGSDEAKTSPKVLITDTVKDIIAPEVTEGGQIAALRSPTPAITTPKAPAVLEKPATSRSPLSRTDVIVNGESDKKRVVPPSQRSPTTSLKIDRFVRPFTIKAVKELLELTGLVKNMWMDQIKTHCFVTVTSSRLTGGVTACYAVSSAKEVVTNCIHFIIESGQSLAGTGLLEHIYSSVEEAVATRNALYNLQWPVAGGRLLAAEFVEPEEVTVRCDGCTDKLPTTPSATRAVPVYNSAPPAPLQGQTPPPVLPPASALPPPPPLPPPPRDRPLPPIKKKELEQPIPTLDDLFKKTRAKPQIYYLPLSDEQVAMKLCGRNKAPITKPFLKA